MVFGVRLRIVPANLKPVAVNGIAIVADAFSFEVKYFQNPNEQPVSQSDFAFNDRR